MPGKPPTEVNGKRTPAVPMRRSFHRYYIVCLECGWRGLMPRRRLATGHGLTVEQYRARRNLPREHPMTRTGIQSGAPVSQNSLALVVAVDHPAKNRSRSRPTSRQHPNRDLDGEEGPDRRRLRLEGGGQTVSGTTTTLPPYPRTVSATYYQPISVGRRPISAFPADSYCAGNAALC
jgi:ROS/MUCR transcriptional regulator protein